MTTPWSRWPIGGQGIQGAQGNIGATGATPAPPYTGDTSGAAVPAGSVGEWKATATGAAAVGSGFGLNTWGNINSLLLTQGNWLIVAEVSVGLLTLVTGVSVALSLNSGNVATDHIEDVNQRTDIAIAAGGARFLVWNQQIGVGGATVYLKGRLLGALLDTFKGAIQAIRIE